MLIYKSQIYKVADEFIRRKRIDTRGYYKIKICYNATGEVNSKITIELELAKLKDAINCIRYVRANLNGDFVEATISAFHFRINSGMSIGYRLTTDSETGNDEVNIAIAELNAGDGSYHENPNWIFWDRAQNICEFLGRK